MDPREATANQACPAVMDSQVIQESKAQPAPSVVREARDLSERRELTEDTRSVDLVARDFAADEVKPDQQEMPERMEALERPALKVQQADLVDLVPLGLLVAPETRVVKADLVVMPSIARAHQRVETQLVASVTLERMQILAVVYCVLSIMPYTFIIQSNAK